MEEKDNAALAHGDYPNPDGTVHHVLEVQDITVDGNSLFERVDQLIVKKLQEAQHVRN